MPETVLILTGPTASGKTALAAELARRWDAEIVSADSRQIYAGMQIGTAAPSPQELVATPHHLVGFLDPGERYSAARFKAEAEAAITGILSRGKRAVVVGGTGFYIRALTNSVTLAPEYDETLRHRLAEEAKIHPPEFLHAWLTLKDPKRAANLAEKDTYRILRALEITLASHETRVVCAPVPWQYTKLILDLPLPELDKRIAIRTMHMLENGLIEEAERIGPDAVAANAVGYPQVFAYLSGYCTYEELRAHLERATRRYARRQRTWFRSEPESTWVHPIDLETWIMEQTDWARISAQ